jgi:IS5 family transposase
MRFQHFCRLDGALHTSDARTPWSFKQCLAQGGLGDRAVFDAVSLRLHQHRYIPRGGQIVDANIVQAPVTQANSDKREALNEGSAPEGWSSKRLQHTERDARWTEKHGKSFYGYKLHANTDVRYKLIRHAKITAANVDDGRTLKDVLDRGNPGSRLLADRVYDAQANRELLQQSELRNGIARGTKPGQKRRQQLDACNKATASGRCEHVFAELEKPGGKCVRALTLAGNDLAILLKWAAAYKPKRLVWLVGHDPSGWAR